MTPWDRAYLSRNRTPQEKEPEAHNPADIALYIVAVIAVAVMVIF